MPTAFFLQQTAWTISWLEKTSFITSFPPSLLWVLTSNDSFECSPSYGSLSTPTAGRSVLNGNCDRDLEMSRQLTNCCFLSRVAQHAHQIGKEYQIEWQWDLSKMHWVKSVTRMKHRSLNVIIESFSMTKVICNDSAGGLHSKNDSNPLLGHNFHNKRHPSLEAFACLRTFQVTWRNLFHNLYHLFPHAHAPNSECGFRASFLFRHPHILTCHKLASVAH